MDGNDNRVLRGTFFGVLAANLIAFQATVFFEFAIYRLENELNIIIIIIEAAFYIIHGPFFPNVFRIHYCLDLTFWYY